MGAVKLSLNGHLSSSTKAKQKLSTETEIAAKHYSAFCVFPGMNRCKMCNFPQQDGVVKLCKRAVG